MNIEIFKNFKAATFSRKAAFSEIHDQPEPYIVFSPLIAMKFEKKNKNKNKKRGRVETLVETQSAEDYCFFVTVANIPAFKMTHRLLAGLPR